MESKIISFKLRPSESLNYYGSVFNTVEFNSAFYRLPKYTDLKKYHNNTSDNFKFSVKVSKYITHTMKLKGTAVQVANFTDHMLSGITDKVDKFLFQLPPSFHYSESNLDLILENIPASPKNVIEFRHNSWWNKKVKVSFKQATYTFCNVDYPVIQNDFIHISAYFYLRLHGVPELFKSSYATEQLKSFAN